MVCPEKGTISTPPVHVYGERRPSRRRWGCEWVTLLSLDQPHAKHQRVSSALYLYLLFLIFITDMQNMPTPPPQKPQACPAYIPPHMKTSHLILMAWREDRVAYPVQGGEWKTTQSERNSEKLPEMLADYNTALMSEPRLRSRPGAGGSPESWIAELLWVEQQFPCRR